MCHLWLVLLCSCVPICVYPVSARECLECKSRLSWSFRTEKSLLCSAHPGLKSKPWCWVCEPPPQENKKLQNLRNRGPSQAFRCSRLGLLCLLTLILSEDHLRHLLTRPTNSETLLLLIHFPLTPITLQKRLCGLRGMMHCRQTPRTSPLNCSTRTLWRDWVQVGQCSLTFFTTWKREEEG